MTAARARAAWTCPNKHTSHHLLASPPLCAAGWGWGAGSGRPQAGGVEGGRGAGLPADRRKGEILGLPAAPMA